MSRRLLVFGIFRALVLGGVYVVLAASDAAWQAVIAGFTGSWAVITAADRLAQRRDPKLRLTRRGRLLSPLADACFAAALATFVAATDRWLLVGWILILFGVAFAFASGDERR